MTACGPVSSTWFSSTVWPTCACGFAPMDNARLRDHWAAAGFKVVDEGGHLVKRSLAPPEPTSARPEQAPLDVRLPGSTDGVLVEAWLHTPSDVDLPAYIVVQIDRDDEEVPMRVYVNDGEIYEQGGTR